MKAGDVPNHPNDTIPTIHVKIIGLMGEELPPGQYDAQVTNTREIRGGRHDGDIAVRARLLSPFPYPSHVEG